MPTIPDGVYDLEAVRKEWIGQKTEVAPGRYPVEYDPIRRHAHMVEDRNPLFLDPEAAKSGKWGAVIAPPVMTGYFAGNGAWPPSQGGNRFFREVPTRGDRMINMNIEWEYLQPAKVGDQLSTQTVLTDIYEKSTRVDPLSVWVVTENRITNQDGELVAVGRNTLLTHRPPDEVAAKKGEA